MGTQNNSENGENTLVSRREQYEGSAHTGAAWRKNTHRALLRDTPPPPRTPDAFASAAVTSLCIGNGRPRTSHTAGLKVYIFS